MNLIFEWDRSKERKNQSKHKIDFDEAKTIFGDPFVITYPDEEHSQYEDRLLSIGYSIRKRMLIVSHTERQETANSLVIRIINCRRVTPVERTIYEDENN